MLHTTIEQLIHSRRVKKTHLAAFLGISRNTLNDYIAGKTFPTSDIIYRIAEYFKLPAAALFAPDNAELQVIKEKSLIDTLETQRKQIAILTEQIILQNKQIGELLSALQQQIINKN